MFILGGIHMKRLIDFISSKTKGVMVNFALAFASGSVRRICFYIFHQPKMPEELKTLRDK